MLLLWPSSKRYDADDVDIDDVDADDVDPDDVDADDYDSDTDTNAGLVTFYLYVYIIAL